MSTPTTSLKTQLETRLDDVQATIASSLVEAPKHHKLGRSKTERRAAHVRQDNSVSRCDKTNSSKGKSTRRVTQPNTCNYERCMRPTTLKTEVVSTPAVVTLRHDQCPADTTVGTKSIDTVTVVAKADGRYDTTRQHHLSIESHIEQFFGEINNEVFSKERAFL